MKEIKRVPIFLKYSVKSLMSFCQSVILSVNTPTAAILIRF